MNIIRPEENAILIWNLELARTAYISGEELTALDRWAAGSRNPFADRLEKLGVISKANRQTVAQAIKASSQIEAPPNSFYAPESIHVEITEKCPLSCPMCYKTSTCSELPIELLLDIIRQAGDMGVFQIALGGGEPLVYPELLTAIGEIASYKMASSITTSGAGLTCTRVEELTQAGLNHIQISLNGSSGAIHSTSRDRFDSGLEALNILQKSDVSYGVNWVARMDNIDDFPQMTRLAKAYNVGNINILRYKPSLSEDYNTVALSAEKTLLLARYIKYEKGVRIKVDSAFSNLRCKLNGRTSFMSGCGAGRRFLAVGACGAYMPCSHVNMKERPVEHPNHLYHVWHHSENLAMFRNLARNISAPCSDCVYLHGCYGCRAVMLSQNGDFNAGDDSCTQIIPIV